MRMGRRNEEASRCLSLGSPFPGGKMISREGAENTSYWTERLSFLLGSPQEKVGNSWRLENLRALPHLDLTSNLIN